LKGENNADCYQEKGLYKYTVGSSADYQEIYQLRKSLLAKFPQAFIIAFKNGEKMDVQAAIREYRSRKK
jgi:N-acetylmuramoyl-L-alanine amidase